MVLGWTVEVEGSSDLGVGDRLVEHELVQVEPTDNIDLEGIEPGQSLLDDRLELVLGSEHLDQPLDSQIGLGQAGLGVLVGLELLAQIGDETHVVKLALIRQILLVGTYIVTQTLGRDILIEMNPHVAIFRYELLDFDLLQVLRG